MQGSHTQGTSFLPPLFGYRASLPTTTGESNQVCYFPTLNPFWDLTLCRACPWLWGNTDTNRLQPPPALWRSQTNTTATTEINCRALRIQTALRLISRPLVFQVLILNDMTNVAGITNWKQFADRGYLLFISSGLQLPRNGFSPSTKFSVKNLFLRACNLSIQKAEAKEDQGSRKAQFWHGLWGKTSS